MDKSKKVKIESISEYMARGGKITRVPSATREPQLSVIRTTTAGKPAVFLSLDEAEFLFGEPVKQKPKNKKSESIKINLDELPAALRSKFIAKLKEDIDAEGYQEELEELEEDYEDEDA